MEIINIENEEQLKELFKTGVRVGETVVINVGSDLEGTIEVWGKLLVTLGSQCKNITVKAYHHSMVGAEHYVSINIIALNGSIVDASGNTKVEAYGNTKVKVGGNAIVEYKDIGEPLIEAYGNAIVKALHGRVMIVAYDKAVVRAHGEVSVKAYAKATVKSLTCREIVLNDFSVGIIGEHKDFGRPDVVVASEKAKVIEY